jgi:hypothetical protein
MPLNNSSNYYEGARVYHNAGQATVSGVNLILTYNSERYDTDQIHDLVVNPDRLTCRTAGIYLITTAVRWQNNANGLRHFWAYLNGATRVCQMTENPAVGDTTYQLLTTNVELVVGDYLQTGVYQNSGVGLSIDSVAQRSPEFMMQRIG